LAMDAIGGVEFDEHRSVEIEDFPGKGSIRGGDGVIGKEAREGKRGLAAAAHGPCVPPPAGRYPVLRPAKWTARKKSITHRGNILAPADRVNVPGGS